MEIFSVAKRHILFLCIVALASVVRLHSISQKMIFIGDQGRDFIVAREIVTKGTIPLLGIPSSVPRFKQGPLSIYFLAIVYAATGGSMFATGLLSTFFSLAAIVVLYCFLHRYWGKSVATLATGMFAFFPMLILHSRMPYHINPLPLAVVVYFWQVCRYYEHNKWSDFLVGLSFAFVFQFELAAFPLFLLIPFVYWQTRFARRIQRSAVTVAGIVVGLSPQVLYDFTHHFTQLGGFAVWMGYKILTAIVPFTKNSFTNDATPAKLSELANLSLSIFTQSGIRMDQVFWLILICLSMMVLFLRYMKLAWHERVIIAGTVVVVAGLVIHRVPSEAYMPLLAPPIAICIAQFLVRVKALPRFVLLSMVILSLAASMYRLEQQSFFLLVDHESQWETKRFGPSLGTQREIVANLFMLSQGHCIKLESIERDRTFPTLYNHLEYLLSLDQRQHSGTCVPIRIDRPSIAQHAWVQTADRADFGAYWAQIIDDRTLYARK